MAKKSHSGISSYEGSIIRAGYKLVAGVDEAGRGPLAGPVVASAVILSSDHSIEGIQDSKSLSPRRRQELFSKIVATSAVGIGVVSEVLIDEINILKAALKAMERAVASLPLKPDWVLVDGPMKPQVPYPVTAIVEGDKVCVSIAAASIIAKVTRDRLMKAYDMFYPQYGFVQHKGYSTRAHCSALERYGPSLLHRYTFKPVKRLME